MAVFPFRRWLYSTTVRVVILGSLVLALWQAGPAQQARRKGPRALGLVQLLPKGKARLIPVVIMDDGKFYDAAAYKATPVPMALESGTVYEAVKTGVSQGLLTIASATHTQTTWIGEGKWQPASSTPPAKAAVATKSSAQDEDAPPVLRRPGAETPKPPEAPAAKPTPVTPAPAAPPPAAEPSPPEDPNRPTLRRGKPATPVSEPLPSESEIASAKARATQFIPAISDAGGADFRPYRYQLKPDEEQQLRKKMLALAANELQARMKQLGGGPETPTSGRTGKASPAGKSTQPNLDDVDFRVFDLSNSNEPILTLSAVSTVSQHTSARDNTLPALKYFVTVVAREDIYGDLHKAFSQVTDARHLDVLPRFELIDAVDADGDGRGELLFQETSDTGSAFAVYRVIGDQLWPLFQGTPGP